MTFETQPSSLTMYSSYIVTTRSVPAKELRQRLAEYLDEARSGRSFDITRSGRPTATRTAPTRTGGNRTGRGRARPLPPVS
jgi:antitoxin (DNA-binding transcriptional repressor) of toxin-antitoxin stability system